VRETNFISEPELLSVPSPFILESSRLCVLESLDTPLDSLYARLLDGTYEKPYIIEDGRLRYLHFGVRYVQSAMRIDRPDVLKLRYTQKMMSFLLFKKTPGRIAMLGLGGGSLAKFCYRCLPDADITVIEIDPHVIALRRHFAIPEDDVRFRVVRGDAAEYVASAVDEPIDVLLADAFDEHGLAHSLASRSFLQHAYAALEETGILVMNLAGDQSRYVELIEAARDIFDRQTLLVPVKDDENYVLFGFKQRHFDPDWHQLRLRAKELKASFELDFPAFVQMMERTERIDTMNKIMKVLAG